jgi:hypothetical protein
MDLRSFKLDASTIPVEEKKDSGKKWRFQRGRYNDVKVEAVEEQGPAKNDPTWINVKFLIGDGKRQISHWVMIPTMRFTYGQNASPYVWLSTVRFLNALGIDINEDNATTIIPVLFGTNQDKLVGLKLDVEIGFKGWYSAKENDKIFLFDEKNKVYCKNGENPESFPDYEAAAVYCEETLKKPYTAFPSIVKLFAATSPNSEASIAAAVKKPEKKAAKLDF